MGIDKTSQFQADLLDIVSDIEQQIQQLSLQDPIFGFISPKYIKCGKKNCKCHFNTKDLHGPYFYLRLEPEYKYNKYLGKQIPRVIKERVEIGSTIKNLEKKRTKIIGTVSQFETIM
ncbi:MAG: DUF6788 family protein [Candidatus Heimdallarchaeaceae archaeon]